MNEAYDDDGYLIRGTSLEKKIILHYKEIHDRDILVSRVKFSNLEFPKLEVSEEMLVDMMSKIKTGKGLGFDGVWDGLFRISKKRWLKK